MLTLRRAINEGRLEEFIRQEEARGILAIDPNELDEIIESAVKAHRSEDRTSGSRHSGGSSGT